MDGSGPQPPRRPYGTSRPREGGSNSDRDSKRARGNPPSDSIAARVARRRRARSGAPGRDPKRAKSNPGGDPPGGSPGGDPSSGPAPGFRGRVFWDEPNALAKIREYVGDDSFSYSVLNTAGRDAEKQTRIDRYLALRRENVDHYRAIMSVIQQRTPGDPVTENFWTLSFFRSPKWTKIGCILMTMIKRK